MSMSGGRHDTAVCWVPWLTQLPVGGVTAALPQQTGGIIAAAIPQPSLPSVQHMLPHTAPLHASDSFMYTGTSMFNMAMAWQGAPTRQLPPATVVRQSLSVPTRGALVLQPQLIECPAGSLPLRRRHRSPQCALSGTTHQSV
jgi:hypothetical protein